MNQYGRMAEAHWRRWLPQRYAALADPESFFSTLGEEVAEEIGNLTMELAEQHPPTDDYIERLGRLNMAELQARELVLHERVLLDPEPEMEDPEVPDTMGIRIPAADEMEDEIDPP